MQIQIPNEQARGDGGKETLPDPTFTLASNSATDDHSVCNLSDLLLAR